MFKPLIPHLPRTSYQCEIMTPDICSKPCRAASAHNIYKEHFNFFYPDKLQTTANPMKLWHLCCSMELVQSGLLLLPSSFSWRDCSCRFHVCIIPQLFTLIHARINQ